jgi:CheY-like chemotaxis protein
MPNSMPNRTDDRPLVLIVDDDFAVRESLASAMQAFGFRTSTAGNGAEGLTALEAEAPSAIITDLHMPEMDGFALISALHRSDTGIPVIAMSGGGTQDIDKARRLGAAAAFHKPLRVLEMIDALHGLTVRVA